MDKTILVAPDFSTGLDVLKALDRATLPVSVALWLVDSEYEEWRFVLASRRLDAAGHREAYGMVHDALSAEGISYEQTPTLMIFKMSDPFIRSLRRMFSKVKNVEGTRLGGQKIGDRFVEAAIVYRVR